MQGELLAAGIQAAGSVLRCVVRGGVADAARRKRTASAGPPSGPFLPHACCRHSAHSRKHRVAASHVRPSCGSSDARCSRHLGRPNYCRRLRKQRLPCLKDKHHHRLTYEAACLPGKHESTPGEILVYRLAAVLVRL